MNAAFRDKGSAAFRIQLLSHITRILILFSAADKASTYAQAVVDDRLLHCGRQAGRGLVAFEHRGERSSLEHLIAQ